MKLNQFLIFFLSIISHSAFSQSVSDLIDLVSKDNIIQTVRDLSGEDSTLVSGNRILITNRASSVGNTLAAEYIVEKLVSYGLDVSTVDYSMEGQNIIATQIGKVYPDSIFIICGHYDAVADYGADDNASGVAALLESARILSTHSFKYTIKYAFWDQEEIGLLGARNYANKARQSNEDLLAVLNIDMIGYDADGDKLFDIDVANIANSYQIRDDLIKVVADHALDLVVAVVDPGTLGSDHAPFWATGYSAVLLGEAWSTEDVTPGYHSSNDRIELFNTDYFHEMVKLSLGYISTKGELISTSGLNSYTKPSFVIYPNPTNGEFILRFGRPMTGKLSVLNVYGESVKQVEINGKQEWIGTIEDMAAGIYIFQVTEANGSISTQRVIKG